MGTRDRPGDGSSNPGEMLVGGSGVVAAEMVTGGGCKVYCEGRPNSFLIDWMWTVGEERCQGGL